MKLQDQRLQFLNDTVYYFGSDVRRRAIEGPEWCLIPKYKTKDGRCCAIGRHIPAELHPEFLSGSIKTLTYNDTPQDHSNRKLVEMQDFLPEKIYMLGPKFLSAVASLHDNKEYWHSPNIAGLSYTGMLYYNKIIREYCSEILDYENYF